jgi:hypothetical protein
MQTGLVQRFKGKIKAATILVDLSSPTAGIFDSSTGARLATGGAGALVAAGTNQATALKLTAAVNVFGTVAAGTGGALPAPTPGAVVTIVNGGANTLAVYGNGADTIDGNPGATGTTLTVAHRVATFYAVSTSAWISALGGAVSS